MKKTLLLTLCILILSLGVAYSALDTFIGTAVTDDSNILGSDGNIDTVLGVVLKTGACSISDDFSSDLTDWTGVHGTWAIVSGELDTSTSYSRTRIHYTACAPTGNDHWVKARIVNPDAGGDFVGVVLRSSASVKFI